MSPIVACVGNKHACDCQSAEYNRHTAHHHHAVHVRCVVGGRTGFPVEHARACDTATLTNNIQQLRCVVVSVTPRDTTTSQQRTCSSGPAHAVDRPRPHPVSTRKPLRSTEYRPTNQPAIKNTTAPYRQWYPKREPPGVTPRRELRSVRECKNVTTTWVRRARGCHTVRYRQ